MKMELPLEDRYALGNILPAEGSYELMTHVGKLRERLTVTKAEKEEFGVTEIVNAKEEPTGALKWNAEQKTERKIEIGEYMFVIIVKILKKLDDGDKIGAAHVSLFKKFVEIPAEEARAATKEAGEKPAEDGNEKQT